MPLDWNSHGICMWKEVAIQEQQGYFHLFGNHMWREYKPSDYINLKRNIGFAVFRLPEKEPDENLNDGTGYTDKQLKHVNKIFDIIKKSKNKHKDQENIWVSFLFVVGKAGDDYLRFPLIRVPEHDVFVQQNNNIFIDFCGRVYKGWQDYLKNNTLPNCVICYPKSGVYSARNGVVEVEFGISPAGKAGRKVLKGFDIGGTVLGVGASGVGIASLCVPVAWPVVAGALAVSMLAGGYGAGCSIQTLVDRGQHQQSIGLDNAESRNCWLGIAGCLMSLASGGAIAAVAKTAQTGASITLAGQVALKSVTVGCCVVNAVGVTSGLTDIIMKAVNKEEITPLDIFQFTSVVLFFTNSVISAHQAFTLINSIGKNSTGQFLEKQAIRNQISELEKRTNVYRSIPLFGSGCSPKMSSTVQATFFGVRNWLSRKLTEITRSLKKGLISIWNYMLKVEKHLHTFCESWKKEMAEVTDKICSAFGVKHWSELLGAQRDQITELSGTVIAERRYWANCETAVMPSEQNQVIADNSDVDTASCISNGPNSMVDEMETSLSYDDEVINILAKFVDRQMCRNPADFPRYMTFICQFVKSQFQEEKSRYEKMYEIVKNYMDVEAFDKKYGICGDPNNHFFNKVFEKFRSDKKDGITLLKLAFESEDACTSTQEKRGQISFDVGGVSFYPFYNKLGLASNGLLSEEQYCEIAAELTGQQADRDSIYISACGATAVMQVNAGADVIMVQCLLEDVNISGIAALLHSPLE